jgi:hypothetical protein
VRRSLPAGAAASNAAYQKMAKPSHKAKRRMNCAIRPHSGTAIHDGGHGDVTIGRQWTRRLALLPQNRLLV